MKNNIAISLVIFLIFALLVGYAAVSGESFRYRQTYPIVDTNQKLCYNNSEIIDCPDKGELFYGQDAQYTGNVPRYTDNGDGTVTDNVTGLMWQKTPDTNGDGAITTADKMTYTEAMAYCEDLTLAAYDDWQVPTIKQLYSLIDFSGKDPSGYTGTDTSGLTPFIDTDYFDFAYGDTGAGERIIDSQYASSTMYVGTAGKPLLFGVNFADGRIKGYGLHMPGPGNREKTFFVMCVRGNSGYGTTNDFVNNGDGTITDRATSLMWAQDDSGVGMTWEEALAWVQQKNAENYLGYSDWRLPNAKELQSIVDYSRSPETTGSAAIDPLFHATAITSEAGQTDYPYYWSSTTHANMRGGGFATYIAFGEGLGWMEVPYGSGNFSLMDVHGAGCQRSDPKSGDPAAFPHGHGPQGDVVGIYNFIRLVRDAPGEVAAGNQNPPDETAAVSKSQVEEQPRTVGLIYKDERASEGYILFSPLFSTETYLIDSDGQLVHVWKSVYPPGQNAYLLENGHLVRTGKVMNPVFGRAGGAGGIVQEFDWDGNLVWEFRYSSNLYCSHHDIELLPNGNIILIAWEYKTREETIAAGRDPRLVSDEGLWSECILEVNPEGERGGEVVWKWCAWDHLIQDYDSTKPNFGRVEEHPELIDLNHSAINNPKKADWLHINALDYNPELDQIVLTAHNFSEIWVISHRSTTEEAADHEGGQYGKGGELLYRWGNPQTYRAGGPEAQYLFGPHCAHWIPSGYPGEGDILIFNNGQGRLGERYSSIEEIVPPVDSLGQYPDLAPGEAFPAAVTFWTYRSEYFSQNISGAERLADGNTLICYGPQGTFEQITLDGQVVWIYINPVGEHGPVAQGEEPLKNAVFSAHWYAADYPALAGRDLSPQPALP